MKNVAAFPSIAPCSNYGDSMIIDALLSKYCDLIPMERYCDIAARDGLEGLPPNSLIGVAHKLAGFLLPVYDKIKAEITGATDVLLTGCLKAIKHPIGIYVVGVFIKTWLHI